jgi:hypothetical protein
VADPSGLVAGVAGWNARLVHERSQALFWGFGTLLGPEGTPGWVLSLATPGLDRLTHPDLYVCGCGGGCGGLGCGCVLSVA